MRVEDQGASGAFRDREDKERALRKRDSGEEGEARMVGGREGGKAT